MLLLGCLVKLSACLNSYLRATLTLNGNYSALGIRVQRFSVAAFIEKVQN